MLQALAGYDPKDPRSDPMPVGDYLSGLKDGVKGLRVGILASPPGWKPDPPVAAALDEAMKVFANLGAVLADVTVPSFALGQANILILLAEAYAYHAADLARSPELYGEQVGARFMSGGLFTAAEYVQAQRIRSKLRIDMAKAMEHLDVLVMPVTPNTASTFEEIYSGAGMRAYSFTGQLDMCGLPALALPTGFDDAGLPTSMQVVGKPFAEATVLRTGYAYQQVTDWHLRRPRLTT